MQYSIPCRAISASAEFSYVVMLLLVSFSPQAASHVRLGNKQEAFEKCWAHSPLRAAARRLLYIAIHQVSLLSHAACALMSTTTSTTTTTTITRDRGDRYGPMEWAQSSQNEEERWEPWHLHTERPISTWPTGAKPVCWHFHYIVDRRR